jgi:hypothetical protein
VVEKKLEEKRKKPYLPLSSPIQNLKQALTWFLFSGRVPLDWRRERK